MDYLGKINALLAKAERTTPEEASALIEKAEEMMIRHGIDRAMVGQSHERAEAIGTDSTVYSGPLRFAWATFGASIAGALGELRCYVRQPYRMDELDAWLSLCIAGYKDDVSAAQALIASLKLQCESAMKAQDEAPKPVKIIFDDVFYRSVFDGGFELDYMMRGMELDENAKVSFIKAYGGRCAYRIAQMKGRIVNETPGTDLVLASRQDRVDKWFDSEVKLDGAMRQPPAQESIVGRMAGANAADSADIGLSGIQQRRDALEGTSHG